MEINFCINGSFEVVIEPGEEITDIEIKTALEAKGFGQIGIITKHRIAKETVIHTWEKAEKTIRLLFRPRERQEQCLVLSLIRIINNLGYTCLIIMNEKEFVFRRKEIFYEEEISKMLE